MKIIKGYETGEEIPEEGIYLTSLVSRPGFILHYYVFYDNGISGGSVWEKK